MPKAKKSEIEKDKDKSKPKTEKKIKKSAIAGEIGEKLEEKGSLTSSEKEDKLAKLKEKAEKLKSKIKDEVEVKKEEEQKTELSLGPVEYFLKASMHLGTRAITPDMRHYIYKRRADSLGYVQSC